MKWAWCVVAVVAVVGCGDNSATNAVLDAMPDAEDDSCDRSTQITVNSFYDGVPEPALDIEVESCDGPWQRLESTDGHYMFMAMGRRYGVTWACTDPFGEFGYTTNLVTTDELTSMTVACLNPMGTLPTISGSITGAASAQIYIGRYTGSASATYTMGAPSGSYDGVAVSPGVGFARQPVTVSGTADFVLSPLASMAASTTNLDPSEILAYLSEWRTNGGTHASLVSDPDTNMHFVPAAAMQAGDVVATIASATGDHTSRSITIEQSSIAITSFTLPTMIDPPTVASTPDGHLHVTATAITGAAGYSFSTFSLGELDASIFPGSTSQLITASAGWIGARPQVELETPHGGPPPYSWSFTAIGDSLGGADVVASPVQTTTYPPGVAGRTITRAMRSGALQH